MRHHGVEKAHQDADRLPNRPAIVGHWRSLDVRQRGLERIGEFINLGDGDIEPQSLDILRYTGERAMGRLAQSQRLLTEAPRLRLIGISGHSSSLVHKSPEPLRKAPSALHPLLG